MVLNVYENKKIIKTYSADTYALMFGTVEDLLQLIKIDDLKGTTKEEIALQVLKAIPGSVDIFKDLMKDIFEGISDEELKNTKIKEIADVIIDVVKFAISELSIGASKN